MAVTRAPYDRPSPPGVRAVIETPRTAAGLTVGVEPARGAQTIGEET